MRIFADRHHPAFPFRYWAICIVYFTLSLVGILHHEIWLDEMHHFLLARDSGSIRELAFNARYDGHPLLWDSLLFFLTRFTHNPFYMQLLHITLTLAAVIIFLRNSPFTDLFKILFVFGYFMLYEYNVISRNYALSVLLLFICCSLICTKKRNYTTVVTSLLILSYTHFFSLICSVSIFLVTISIYMKDNEREIQKSGFLFLCIAYVLVTVLILWSIVPPADHLLISNDTTPYLSFKRIGKGFSIFFKGLYHLPDFTKYNFWNTNLFVDVSKNMSIVPSVFCFIIPFLIFFDKPQSLLVFYLSAIGIAVFIFWSPVLAGVRYFGFIFLLFILALWLSYFSHDTSPKNLPANLTIRIRQWNERIKIPFVYSFLFLQLFSSVIAYSLDIIRPFSEGKAVAEYLKEKKLTGKIIVVNFQSSGPPISGYLGQKIYYPETGELGSFCKWNFNPSLINKNELISRIKKINAKDFILILNDSMLNTSLDFKEPVYTDDELKIFFLSSFHQGIMRTENYRLYEVRKTDSSSFHSRKFLLPG